MMMKIFCCISRIFLIICCMKSQYNAAQNIDGATFTQVLKSIANDALGVAKVQEEYDKVIYKNTLLDGTGLVTEISTSLSRKFDGPIQALKRIKEVVEQDINSYTTTRTLPQCCQATGVTYNSKFKSEINTNEACVTISSESPPESTFPNKRIQDVMKENYRNNPNLKWQYFGKEDGIYVNFPSVKLSDCSNYDPRYRPFYVTSATPVEKDVVIVIDRSGSMSAYHKSRTLLQIAKEAAMSVLDTLNPNDRFGVVAFDTQADIPGDNQYKRSCYETKLAQATPLNINYMKNQIRNINLGSATNYEAAVNFAFRFFINTDDNGQIKKEKVILFLTDGEKTAGGDPLDTIRDKNKELQNEVTILTYGLGSALSPKAISMLTSMALQTRTDPAFGEVKTGIFEHIKNASYLRSAMASYYNLFSTNETVANPIFSVPYQDLFGIGLISSICMPLYSNKGLFGVACSDATLSDIVADISYFRQGEYSYAFIIDGIGRTLMHPMLPLPYSVKDDPIYVDIKNLERSSAAIDVVTSMMVGLSGKSTFHSMRTIPRGDMLYEGIETKNILSHYYWKPVGQSNFSVCIVVGESDKQAVPEPQPAIADSFVYHRLGLIDADGANCRHFRRFATKEKSVVMLTPGAFKDPFRYLDTDEAISEITAYENFLTGKNSYNPGLKDSIKNSVATSYTVEDIWKKSESLSGYVVWRYIGTTDGVMRLYPGVEIAKNYDHTKRGWYKRTLALKGINVISAPYLDLWGSGYLITLSKTITARNNGGQLNSDGQTVAVIGIDFTINYFYQMLQVTYTECKNSEYSCFVIDSSGGIVMHEDFVKAKSSTPEIENVHITYKEKAIANDLLMMNIMVKTGCIDFENIKIQHTYKVSMTTNGLDRRSSNAKYQIQKVPESNVFIIIKQRVSTIASCCQSYGTSPDTLKCRTYTCDCLCYNDADFDYCNNTYNLLSDAPQTCSPREPKLQTENLNDEDKIKNLLFCFDPKCKTRMQKSDCFSVAGCSWCSLNCRGNNLGKPYCDLQSQCYFGQEGTKDPYGTSKVLDTSTCLPGSEGGDTGGLGGGAIAGIIIGVLLVVAIIVGGYICYKRHQASKPDTTNQTSLPRATDLQHGHFHGHDNLAFNANNQSAHYNAPSAPPAIHPPSYEDIDYVSPVHNHDALDLDGYAKAYY